MTKNNAGHYHREQYQSTNLIIFIHYAVIVAIQRLEFNCIQIHMIFKQRMLLLAQVSPCSYTIL